MTREINAVWYDAGFDLDIGSIAQNINTSELHFNCKSLSSSELHNPQIIFESIEGYQLACCSLNLWSEHYFSQSMMGLRLLANFLNTCLEAQVEKALVVLNLTVYHGSSKSISESTVRTTSNLDQLSLYTNLMYEEVERARIEGLDTVLIKTGLPIQKHMDELTIYKNSIARSEFNQIEIVESDLLQNTICAAIKNGQNENLLAFSKTLAKDTILQMLGHRASFISTLKSYFKKPRYSDQLIPIDNQLSKTFTSDIASHFFT